MRKERVNGLESFTRAVEWDAWRVESVIRDATKFAPYDQGHGECDEIACKADRKVSGKCAKVGTECEYPIPKVPLRDRKNVQLPGEQQPWAVTSTHVKAVKALSNPLTTTVDLNPVDSFNCLPVEMPLKSKQLLHYFFKLDDILHPDTCKRAKQVGIAPFVIQSPNNLRYTLLVASLHYIWQAGDIQTYKSTALFHKVVAIQSLNKLLENPRKAGITTLIKHIATLALVEGIVGNLSTAEAHLDGLMTLLELHDPSHHKPTSILMSFDEELAYRYMILAYNFIHSMRGRMQASADLGELLGQFVTDFAQFVSLVSDWFLEDSDCLQTHLNAMAMFPFFFASLPPAANFRNVDASPFIECLRSMTEGIKISGQKEHNRDKVWKQMMSAITGLQFGISNSHVLSLFEEPVSDRIFRQNFSSWCGITITSSFYLNYVVGLWNAGVPIEYRLFRRLLIILTRDLFQSGYKPSDASTLWFWEHFVAAYSVMDQKRRGFDPTLQAVEDYLARSIRRWSKDAGITQWEEARDKLFQIAWPIDHPEGASQRVWEQAVESRTFDMHGLAKELS